MGLVMIPYPSANFGARRHGCPPDMVVLHHTAMLTADAALERLCDPKSDVSAHYLISETGAVYQLVPDEMRAWHAGAGTWGSVEDVNSHSIGIELANPGPLAETPPFPEPQMASLQELLQGLLTKWKIAPERVIAHSDMAPERKFDPGPVFDWRSLALGGLSVWPDPGTPGDFAADSARFGYDAKGNLPLAVVLAAFRLRFRPGVSGPLDAVDCALIADLASRFPVDLTIGGA